MRKFLLFAALLVIGFSFVPSKTFAISNVVEDNLCTNVPPISVFDGLFNPHDVDWYIFIEIPGGTYDYQMYFATATPATDFDLRHSGGSGGTYSAQSIPSTPLNTARFRRNRTTGDWTGPTVHTSNTYPLGTDACFISAKNILYSSLPAWAVVGEIPDRYPAPPEPPGPGMTQRELLETLALFTGLGVSVYIATRFRYTAK